MIANIRKKYMPTAVQTAIGLAPTQMTAKQARWRIMKGMEREVGGGWRLNRIGVTETRQHLPEQQRVPGEQSQCLSREKTLLKGESLTGLTYQKSCDY